MGPLGLPVEQGAVAADGSTSTPEWYYLDFNGNTRLLEDGSGSVKSTENYPPYGQVSASSNAAPLQYAGSYVDGYTGLVYDQARWYDPPTGQFLSPDRGANQSLQPYAYTADDPVNGGQTSGSGSGRAPYQPPCEKGASPVPFHIRHRLAAGAA